MTATLELDNTTDSPVGRPPLVLGNKAFGDVTQAICNVAERRTTKGWWIAFGVSVSFLVILGLCLIYLVTTGVGVWGTNEPVSWAFPITNFVFWVGIGHAGTLISAILFLFRQNWRTGINRFAEAMTIFAVVCAGMFPGIHVGRPWLAYWLFPLPNQMSIWPQFRSPLLWDVFAVSTYATVSLLFWYMGMVPDLATLRDRAQSRAKQVFYGIFALGWNGSSRQWHRFERAYLILAALATPLVLSVHSVVSFDFATAQLPGWHTTIFPPYFVAGAIFGGFAMVLILAVPARQFFGLQDIITPRHIENMCKVMLGTGLIVAYGYSCELFMSWYGADHYEHWTFINRALGPYAWAHYLIIFCNCLTPQILWIKKMRTNMFVVFVVAFIINAGMWFERFVIIVSTLARDFLPSSWWLFKPTAIDILTLAGSFGLFFTLFLLFCRFLPVVAMAEVKTTMPQAHPHSGPGGTSLPDEKRSDYWPDHDVKPEPDEPGNGSALAPA